MPTDAQGRAILIAQGEDTVLSCDDTVHTETPFASPLKSPASERDRYERLREEAARHGTQMLEEEKERNREMTALLKERIEKLEHDLENTRTRLAKKCTQYEEVLLMANEIALAYERRLNHSTRDQAVQTEAGKWREYRSRHAARESGRNAVEITETQQGDIGGSMSSLHPHAENLPAQVADQDQDCGDHHARPLLSRDRSCPSAQDTTWSASAVRDIDHGDTSFSGRLAGALEPVLSLLSPRGGADAPLQSHPSLLSQAQTSVMSLLSPRRQGGT